MADYSPVRDLAAALFELLDNHCSACAANWRDHFINTHSLWQQSRLPETLIQIREINFYWRIQLASLDEETLGVRSCLIDEIDAMTWLQNFQRYVLPMVVYHRLPNPSFDPQHTPEG